MQADLDAYLEIYNRNRPHRARNMEGRTAIRSQEGDPEAREPEEVNREGGQNGRLKR